MEIENSKLGVNYLSFSREGTFLCIGTNKGFQMYHSSTATDRDRPEFTLFRDVVGAPCGLVKNLGESFLVVMVGTGDTPSNSQRKLTLKNLKHMENIKTYEQFFITPILDVKLDFKVYPSNPPTSNSMIAVVLETSIYLYSVIDKGLLLQKKITTNPNPRGLCDIAITSATEVRIAYPKNALESNEIMIYNYPQDMEALNIIRPTNISLLSALTFDRQGAHLAVADQYGCTIEVFVMGDNSREYIFYRGKTSTSIRSISFHQSSRYLVVSSDSSTVHIFKLSPASEVLISQAQNNILSSISSLMVGQRSVVKIEKKKNEMNERSICAFSAKNPNILVVATQATVRYWKIPEEEGGETPEIAYFSIN